MCIYVLAWHDWLCIVLLHETLFAYCFYVESFLVLFVGVHMHDICDCFRSRGLCRFYSLVKNGVGSCIGLCSLCLFL